MYEQGLSYVDKRQFDKAIPAFIEAGAWDEAGGLLDAYAKGFYESGRADDVRGWLAAMDETELKSRPALLILFGRILLKDFLEYDEAIALLVEARRQYNKLRDQGGVFEARTWLGLAYRLKGDCKQALKLLDATLADYDRCLPGQWRYALAVLFRGTVLLAMGERDKALLDYRKSLKVFESLEDGYYIAVVNHEIGFCLERTGLINESECYYQVALTIWLKRKDLFNQANSYNSLGSLHHLAGRYKEALEKLETCLVIAGDIDSPRRESFAWAGIGDVKKDSGDLEGAIVAYESALKVAIDADIGIMSAYSMLGVGKCLLHQGDTEAAISAALRAGELASRCGLNNELGMSMALRASVLMRSGGSFLELSNKAILLLSGNRVEKLKAMLRRAYGLLFCENCSVSAFDSLCEVLPFLQGDVLNVLAPVLLEVRAIFDILAIRDDVPTHIKIELDRVIDFLDRRPGYSNGVQLLALGDFRLITPQRGYGFKGGHRAWEFPKFSLMMCVPELLSYMVIQNRPLKCRDINNVLWPGRENVVTVALRRLKDDYSGADFLKREKWAYTVDNCWADVAAFERLYFRARSLSSADALPLYRSMLHLYRGDFLTGFDLSAWGLTYRQKLAEKYDYAASMVAS